MSLPEYEIYAIKYAQREATRRDHFIFADPHEGPSPMDYFVWVLIDGERRILVDTGFNAEEAKQRKRDLLRCPADALSLLGMDASGIEDVVITHLHYDHAGNLDKFPKARFHVQDRELAYATGRYMRYPVVRQAFSVDHVTAMVRAVYDDRVVFHEGDAELAPGVSVHHVGGHTKGLQIVRVHTRRGWVVLASDAAHFLENLQKRSPFVIVDSVSEMLDGFERIEALADGAEHIIAGHDPLVLRTYPAPGKELTGIVARLD